MEFKTPLSSRVYHVLFRSYTQDRNELVPPGHMMDPEDSAHTDIPHLFHSKADWLTRDPIHNEHR